MIVRSPCIKICTMDPETGLCEGCFRTLEEIGRWVIYTEEERKAIRIKIDERKESLGKDYFRNS
ncbi:DUF1289 domain-containing protein [Leptospira semungkisensis]|uniref:DUF1289 domain-containing protein n=1 Tax=Leptospira semungkisensis TaxID=2484985 RepID=A0A4R9G6K8_9LEPT|nr:DUF1289 domain-containing protein [Leptospira semungkisensis]TGK07061.1 DUF1289 domain-containing protein [Leptospira semungkisensis]